jgi:hypothetical protein
MSKLNIPIKIILILYLILNSLVIYQLHLKVYVLREKYRSFYRELGSYENTNCFEESTLKQITELDSDTVFLLSSSSQTLTYFIATALLFSVIVIIWILMLKIKTS